MSHTPVAESNHAGGASTPFAVGTFNLENLARPGVEFYPGEKWTDDQVRRKKAALGHVLRNYRADVWVFQEVWDGGLLREVVAEAGMAPGFSLIESDQTRIDTPRVWLLARAQLVARKVPMPSTMLTPVEIGDPEKDGSKLVVRVTEFERAPVVADIDVAGRTIRICGLHMKSKRPAYPKTASVTVGGIPVAYAPEDILPDLDPRSPPIGLLRSSVQRLAEAAATRRLLVDWIEREGRAVIVAGDLNDTPEAVSTQIIRGDTLRFSFLKPRDRLNPVTGEPYDKAAMASVVARFEKVRFLDAAALFQERARRDVFFTHIFSGDYATIDHILLSRDLTALDAADALLKDRYGIPERVPIGSLVYVNNVNDHLTDKDAGRPPDAGDRVVSDHGAVIAHLSIRRA